MEAKILFCCSFVQFCIAAHLFVENTPQGSLIQHDSELGRTDEELAMNVERGLPKVLFNYCFSLNTILLFLEPPEAFLSRTSWRAFKNSAISYSYTTN